MKIRKSEYSLLIEELKKSVIGGDIMAFEPLIDACFNHGRKFNKDFGYKNAVVMACRYKIDIYQKDFAEKISSSKRAVEDWERGLLKPSVGFIYTALTVCQIPLELKDKILSKCN